MLQLKLVNLSSSSHFCYMFKSSSTVSQCSIKIEPFKIELKRMFHVHHNENNYMITTYFNHMTNWTYFEWFIFEKFVNPKLHLFQWTYYFQIILISISNNSSYPSKYWILILLKPIKYVINTRVTIFKMTISYFKQ